MPTDEGPTSPAAWYNDRARLPTDTPHYGPDIPTEATLRLCGDVRGKRVLELGCGGAQAAIAFARAGAVAIGVDPSAEALALARRRCDDEGVRVDLHQGDLAALAFLRADSIDVAFSAYALAFVDDVSRVFRQVHRVLKPNAPLVFSVPHPLATMLGTGEAAAPVVRRSYFDPSPLTDAEAPVTTHPLTVSGLFTALVRANFRVDALLEPEPTRDGPRSPYWHDVYRVAPPTLVMRARKEGL
jgi:SAM-dependent methyltransferase